MTKLLITGASGMLGYDVCKLFSKQKDYQIFPFSHKELDITDIDLLERYLSDISPDVVINCAAYTKVDLCEEKRELAFKINRDGPYNLARLCSDLDVFLVHISTDYVFSGTKKRPYKEEDTTYPINVYGASKLAGERKILETFSEYLIIRTSWLFGINGPNFIKTILGLAHKLDTLKVVDDQRGRPTYTKDLAVGIKWLLEQGARGVFHVTNDGECSWYELAKFAIREKKIDVEVIPVDSTQFKRPAKRPSYSVLDTSKFKSTCKNNLRHWKEAVKDYLGYLD